MSINSPYKTLQDIREAVITDSKAGPLSNANLQSQINRFINEGYQDLITRRKREWLDEDYNFILQAKITGSCQATNGSTTITFDSSTTLTSTTGYFYKLYIGGQEPIYDVSSIGSSTVTLASAYVGETDSSLTATLVQSGLTLAAEVKTLYQADHDYAHKLVDLRGRADFAERVQRDPQRLGYADIATTTGTNSAGQSVMLFYPYPESKYTLKLHGSKYFTELSADTDEPMIPTEYRQILYHYAIARVYATISRNADLFTEADTRYRNWLARLDTEVKPAQDSPRLFYDRSVAFANPFRRFRNQNRYSPEDE